MEFQLPENLAELSLEQLDTLEASCVAEFAPLNEAGSANWSTDQLAYAERLAEGRAAIRTQRAALQDRASRASAAAAAFSDDTPPAEPVDPSDVPADPAPSEPAEPSSPGDGGATAPAPEPAAPPAGGEPSGDAVVASGSAQRRSTVNAVARRSGATAQHAAAVSRNRGRATITAAQNVPNFSMGQELTLETVAQAANGVIERLPKRPSGVRHARRLDRYNVATLRRGDEAFGGLTHDNPEFSSLMALLAEAGRETRLGESLVAAGGWCSPSETIYDLCVRETTDGLVDVPEVRLSRGGLRWTLGPDFSEIYNSPGFCQTEAQAEAGEEKPCFDIPCPPFQEERLDACGFCLRAGILTNVTYPELIDRWISGGIIAHQHRMSARKINQLVALLTGESVVTIPDGTWAATAKLLGVIEAVVNGQREAFRMSRTATMEAIFPFWLRSVVRADLSNRTGVDMLSVTDQQIDNWFGQRGVRAQFVYNYQPLTLERACIDGYPETVQFPIYPAGTFVNGVEDVISLDAVYDTAGLQENTYTGMFFEEAMVMMKQCHGGCLVEVPLNITGETGAANIAANELILSNFSS